jgi:hypothetical protein
MSRSEEPKTITGRKETVSLDRYEKSSVVRSCLTISLGERREWRCPALKMKYRTMNWTNVTSKTILKTAMIFWQISQMTLRCVHVLRSPMAGTLDMAL